MSSAESPRSTYKKLVATEVSSQFRSITKIVSVPFPPKIPVDHLLIRNFYAGVNASDINYTAGKYIPGIKPPFDTGFEAASLVIAIGGNEEQQSETRKKFKVQEGDCVVVTSYGTYAEYQVVAARHLANFKSTPPSPQLMPLLVSGLTASISLEQCGEMSWKSDSSKPFKSQVVLVTAGAGATGLFAVQLAKLAGHHVIATCSNEQKVDYLKNVIGVDRVINYKKESLDNVLKTEYKKGVDIIYESVGGETFDICLKHLSIFGKLIVIGMISGYEDQTAFRPAAGTKNSPPRPHVSAYILGKSASIRGFFLSNYVHLWKSHLEKLGKLIETGVLKAVVDEKKFEGLEQVADAVDYMYSGKNIGKVVVKLIGQKEEKQLLEQVQQKRKALKAKL